MRVRDALLKELKKALGTGGALEAREIVLQGDRRETAKAWLIKQGYTTNL
jgi:translation initiation factor 1 (eIF-1/SUI1)